MGPSCCLPLVSMTWHNCFISSSTCSRISWPRWAKLGRERVNNEFILFVSFVSSVSYSARSAVGGAPIWLTISWNLFTRLTRWFRFSLGCRLMKFRSLVSIGVCVCVCRLADLIYRMPTDEARANRERKGTVVHVSRWWQIKWTRRCHSLDDLALSIDTSCPTDRGSLFVITRARTKERQTDSNGFRENDNYFQKTNWTEAEKIRWSCFDCFARLRLHFYPKHVGWIDTCRQWSDPHQFFWLSRIVNKPSEWISHNYRALKRCTSRRRASD